MRHYKNNYVCRTKAPHQCNYCKETIPAGSNVRTINPKYEDRYWVCNECNDLIVSIIDAKRRRDNTAFDDDGGWLANNDYLGKLVDEFASCCKNDRAIQDIDEFVSIKLE